jgi:hypothetical protein
MSSVPRDARSEVRTANKIGLTEVVFETTWWCNNVLGAWQEKAWAVIDFQTDDAYHLAFGTLNDGGTQPHLNSKGVFTDEWVPKSKVTLGAQPDWDTYSPDGDIEGEVIITGMNRTRYGPKACLWGDTYDAFKGDETPDPDLDWDETHHTYNGTCWECDPEATEDVAEALSDAGFLVRIAP